MGVLKMFKMCFTGDSGKKKPSAVAIIEKKLDVVVCEECPTQQGDKEAPIETDDSCSIEIHSSVEDSDPEYLYTSADHESDADEE